MELKNWEKIIYSWRLEFQGQLRVHADFSNTELILLYASNPVFSFQIVNVEEFPEI